MIKKSILSFLTIAFNRYLQLDPEANNHLERLDGNCIAIKLLPFEFEFYFLFSKSHVDITLETSLATNVAIQGTPLNFAEALINHSQNNLVITGQAEIAQGMLNLLNAVQIDWEELISKVIGDAGAHTISQLANRTESWLKTSLNNFTQQIDEYVHEEKEWLPSREALADYFNEVDEIKMTVERVEARIMQLLQELDIDPQTIRKTP